MSRLAIHSIGTQHFPAAYINSHLFDETDDSYDDIQSFAFNGTLKDIDHLNYSIDYTLQ